MLDGKDFMPEKVAGWQGFAWEKVAADKPCHPASFFHTNPCHPATFSYTYPKRAQ